MRTWLLTTGSLYNLGNLSYVLHGYESMISTKFQNYFFTIYNLRNSKLFGRGIP